MLSRNCAKARARRRAVLVSTSLLALSAGAAANAGPKPTPLSVLTPTAPIVGNGPVSPLYGNLRSFYGNLRSFSGDLGPFYGNLRSFYGNLRSFQGQADPFWGDMTTFSMGAGANTSNVPLNYAGLGAFVTDLSSQWSTLGATWSNLGAYSASNTQAYATVNGQLKDLVSSSSTFWGATVTARTGQSFNDVFVTPLLSKYGIDLNDPSSLAKLSPVQQSQFIYAWYDGLMEFTGTDHVDHWMSEVNWSPSLTQIQGAGSNSIVGLLDFTIKDAPDIQDNVTSSGGVSTYSTGHGAAVASLIVAAHDGSGVMGIAPNASVVAYNPFDSTGTAAWSDISNGAVALGQHGASVINASLGVSGYTLHPDWSTVFTNVAVRAADKNAVFVIAAGNDGVSQTTNVPWDKSNASFIVVGSVDPTLTISSFSNQPGSACLTYGGKCNGDYLMNHFITASGEWLLVSNDQGGFTRMSGTSFAAPLVSGAIALLQDRWPWLAQHPKDEVGVILRSAKDLGAPGPDPVYGVGLLDVTASQSPLSYDKLQYFQSSTSAVKSLGGQAGAALSSIGGLVPIAAPALRDPKQQATWEAGGVAIYAFEQLTESYRDFAIPLSSKLVGQTAATASGQQMPLQSYLTSSFMVWATPTAPAAPAPKSKLAFLNFQSAGETPLSAPGGLNFSMSAQPVVAQTGWRSSSSPFATRFALATADGASGVKFGFGEGASAVGGVTGLSMHSDYDPTQGGGNPLLGFASGGAYAAGDYALTKTLRLSAGMTTRDGRRDLDSLSVQDRMAALAAGDYKANAARVGLTWRAASRLQLSFGYSHLKEADGLLGVQSTDRNDLRDGSQTDGLDMGADIMLGAGFDLSGSATVGRTRAQAAASQNLVAAPGGITSSAFEMVLSKTQLLGDDRLRLSLSQPVHTESGRLAYSGVQVVDRETGELGVVTQSFDAAQNARPLVAEMLYARSVMDGAGEVGVFTRAENRGVDLQGRSAPVVMSGAKFTLRY